MIKYFVGIAVVVLLAIMGWYVVTNGNAAPAPAPVTGPAQAATSTYATSTFSVVYPSDFTTDSTYQYTQVDPKKPISGVKFTIPGAMATGTNLASDTYVSVEQLPRAKNCTGDIYLADNVKAASESYNGVAYSVATTSGAAAGNFYEEAVYALAGSSPCTAVRYLLHSMNIGNFEPGVVREFDRAALLTAFDSIRDSLSLAASAPEATGVTP